MIYAIILAGGSGSRFWPLSRQDHPKQFLNLCSRDPSFLQAILRVKKVIPEKNIYIATNRIYRKNILSCLGKISILKKNIFFEPEAKNTFAPIALLSSIIYKADPLAVIAVFASDHYIKGEGNFVKVLKKAVIAAKGGHIVTIGVNPTSPETGYGYIKVKLKVKSLKPKVESQKPKVYSVERFIEKPKINLVKKFIQDKRYYWNAGMFIFRAECLLGEIKKFLPADYALLQKINSREKAEKLWSKFISTSIDYAIMEKTRKIALIPADFYWSDLGSWAALESLLAKDRQGNILRGNCLDIGSKNTFAWSKKGFLATIGLKNLIVVSTDDALLVCAKERAQDVKKIVEILKEQKPSRLI